MSLVELISNYKSSLAVETEAETVIGRYRDFIRRTRDFGKELVRLPSFTYTRYNMRTAITHMIELDFDTATRCHVAAYSMRRAAMEAVSDISVREGLWNVWNRAINDDPNTPIKALLYLIGDQVMYELFVRKIGKPKLDEYLSKVDKGFQAISDELCAVVNEISTLTPMSDNQRLAIQTAQDHQLLFGTESSTVFWHVARAFRFG